MLALKGMSLTSIAKQVRKDILVMLNAAGSGHAGSSLSSVELLVSLYFGSKEDWRLSHKPAAPHWDGRDYIVLSKGHAAPALYTVLARAGYFPVEELKTLRKINSRLQGHVNIKVPGVEVNAGSLGQGISAAVGMAFALKREGKPNRVYAILGDGELDEGETWEAFRDAVHEKLDNLCIIIDRNHYQQDGETDTITSCEPVVDKLEAYGLETEEIDGHNFDEILTALSMMNVPRNRPYAIIAETVKGKGVSFIEADAVKWHGRAPNDEELKLALQELDSADEEDSE